MNVDAKSELIDETKVWTDVSLSANLDLQFFRSIVRAATFVFVVPLHLRSFVVVESQR